MMDKLTQAKDAVAKKNGYESAFDFLVNSPQKDRENHLDEVAIEYHRLMSEWVSVETYFPNIEKEVLVFHKTQGFIIMTLEYNRKEKLVWYDLERQECDFETVKSWMPLPQLPK